MTKTTNVLKEEYAAIRAGRANAAVLDRVNVDYYGVPTPINQVATVSVTEARTLTIQPWDASSLGAIEKAILAADVTLSGCTSDPMVVVSLLNGDLSIERKIINFLCYQEEKQVYIICLKTISI